MPPANTFRGISGNSLAQRNTRNATRRHANPFSFFVKDLLDRALAFFALLVLSPLLLLIALAIRLESPGPVIFRQERGGRYGKPFEIIKFRTMVAEACEAMWVEQARPGDPRITPLGHWLRRTSIDELPQLLNVLRGEMSIVGARPHALTHDSYYRHHIREYDRRMTMKPGLTGWAQVNGLRGHTATIDAMRARVEHDLYYVKHWSLALDLRIMLRTFKVVLSALNAH